MVTRTRLVTSWYSVCVLLSVGISEVYFFATEVSGVHNLHHQYIMELRRFVRYLEFGSESGSWCSDELSLALKAPPAHFESFIQSSGPHTP